MGGSESGMGCSELAGSGDNFIVGFEEGIEVISQGMLVASRCWKVKGKDTSGTPGHSSLITQSSVSLARLMSSA